MYSVVCPPKVSIFTTLSSWVGEMARDCHSGPTPGIPIGPSERALVALVVGGERDPCDLCVEPAAAADLRLHNCRLVLATSADPSAAIDVIASERASDWFVHREAGARGGEGATTTTRG